MKVNAGLDRLVYSTEHGKMCPGCRQPVAECVCHRRASPVSQGVVRVLRETKGRQGKEVTVIRGVALDPVSLAQLGRQLKTTCGSGGTVKEGVIEIQGDHVEQVLEQLRQQGWVAKRGGG
ncbi:MAG: translation initiation factor Sui1 [Magnetococcales bacterium]|nr:translation initiation factor Sui1 [Magnetococcales bacterium]